MQNALGVPVSVRSGLTTDRCADGCDWVERDRRRAAPCVRVEIAPSRVPDHALTQRADSGSVAHGVSVLSEVDDTSILRTRLSTPLAQAHWRFGG